VTGGLYDVSARLHLRDRVVGNTVDADGKSLVLITGANQGGKSTFLRSVGLAQLMMQAGMFVAADRLPRTSALFTHYKREEDATMELGKLDEELARMSAAADAIRPDEGSEIARQVVSVLIESRVKVFFVTHLFDFADSVHRQARGDVRFLRAERESDGRRTFRLVEGEPLPTSFGEDSYRRICGAAARQPARGAAS
jgi:DNA mismatch repair ATPase MutS